ncbi:MAG: ABC transporter substrate-binding protein [Clostridia bacterium]|nr:ABC transporter substrate-binding protein [Clostridia bacterium]
MKKLFALVLVLLMALSSVAFADADRTITLMIDNTTSTAGIEAVAAWIEETYGIALEIQFRPGGAEGENYVRTLLAAGEMADLCYFNAGSLLQTLNPAQYFVELNDNELIANVSESYFPCVSVDGKIYGIPAGSSFAGAWLYNKAVYAELGLEIPHTWDDLMANCQVIKDAGKTAVIASFGDDWTSQLILLGDYYNVEAGNPDFAKDFESNKAKYATDPYGLDSFKKMEEVFQKGFMNADYNTNTYDFALEMLVNGDGAHYPMLTNSLTNIYTNYGQEAVDNIGVFGQPGDDPDNHGLTVWMPNAIYIYKNGSNVDTAMEWCSYFLSYDGIAVYSAASKPEGPFVVNGVELEDVYAGVEDMMPYFAEGKTTAALEFVTSVKGPNSPQICIECMGGLRSAEEAAAEYDADAEKQAKQLGIAGW